MRKFTDMLISTIEKLKGKYDDIDGIEAHTKFYAYTDTLKIIDQLLEKVDMGNISDGYHTFDELYHHRAVLFSVICNTFKDVAWKSKLHDTGDMYEGMFIVGIETPQGQATYHYDIEPYWDMFDVKELERAPKWDGHTPDEAIERIQLLHCFRQSGEGIDAISTNRFKESKQVVYNKAIDDVFDFLKTQRDKRYMKVRFDDLEIRKYKEQMKGDMPNETIYR